MRRDNDYQYGRVKKSRFPLSLFAILMAVLLLMSGVHTGLLVVMDALQWNQTAQIIFPMIYWGMVAVGLTLLSRRIIRNTYEEPMHKLAEAARKVAGGDFSVYVPTLHTTDKRDYLDVMILDFNKMVEELGSIETLKTDFISNVSHEMKTPIAIIKNYAELLQRGPLPEEQQQEYAQAIETATVRLSDLISNILKLNKLENQRILSERKSYDISRQLCDCVLQFEEVWEEKGIELEAELEDQVMVLADEGLLELVWNNLISNALKFTKSGGRVTIRQIPDRDYVRVSIADTGCGMGEDCLKHIFDKFYQGDTSHSIEGNGLGLALVKRVLELMEGEILVSSEVGKGSTFTVTLPADNRKKEMGGEP